MGASVLPSPENGEDIVCGTGGVLVVDILCGRGFKKVTSLLDQDELDPYICLTVSGNSTVRTASKTDDDKPHFNERFVFTVAKEFMEGGELKFKLMDTITRLSCM